MRLTVLGIVAFALSVFLACTTGGGDQVRAPTVAPTATTTTPSDGAAAAGGPAIAVEQIVQACREKDGDRLRSFVAAAVSEDELEALFARGTDVRLESQTPAEQVEEDSATVVVRLEVQRDGALETVERTWQLERGADGVWRLASLPDCF